MILCFLTLKLNYQDRTPGTDHHHATTHDSAHECLETNRQDSAAMGVLDNSQQRPGLNPYRTSSERPEGGKPQLDHVLSDPA